MMVSSLLVAAVLASSAFAIPIRVPRAGTKSVAFSKAIKPQPIANLVAADRSRAKHLANKHKAGKRAAASDESTQATNIGSSYIAEVQVGTPPQTFKLIVDTGSSNTWVGAGTQFSQSSTVQDTGNQVAVSYGSGNMAGEEVTDTVSLSDDLVITSQSIGVATQAVGFAGVDGIIGVGPTDLTSGTVENTDTVPTVMDNLAKQGLITNEILGISFQPTDQATAVNGVLTWGGTDSSLFTGDITFTPITQTAPASNFWGVDAQNAIGGQTILDSAGIVDTGTTLVLLATDAFQSYLTATGGQVDQQTGLISVTAEQFAQLQPLDFIIGGQTFSLSPDAQLFPQALNVASGGNADDFFLIVSDLGTPSGQGLDFIYGQSFLERFYSVFDTDNNQVGIAQTPFTNEIINQISGGAGGAGNSGTDTLPPVATETETTDVPPVATGTTKHHHHHNGGGFLGLGI